MVKFKYQYTQHTPGHIAVPVIDAAGNQVMIQPDTKAVQAAIANNTKRQQIMNKAQAQIKNWKKGMKPIKVAVPSLVRVPQAKTKVTDIIMTYNGVYELPSELLQVVEMVGQGYLIKVVEPPAAAAKSVTGAATVPSVDPDKK